MLNPRAHLPESLRNSKNTGWIYGAYNFNFFVGIHHAPNAVTPTGTGSRLIAGKQDIAWKSCKNNTSPLLYGQYREKGRVAASFLLSNSSPFQSLSCKATPSWIACVCNVNCAGWCKCKILSMWYVITPTNIYFLWCCLIQPRLRLGLNWAHHHRSHHKYNHKEISVRRLVQPSCS